MNDVKNWILGFCVIVCLGTAYSHKDEWMANFTQGGSATGEETTSFGDDIIQAASENLAGLVNAKRVDANEKSNAADRAAAEALLKRVEAREEMTKLEKDGIGSGAVDISELESLAQKLIDAS